MSWQRSTYRDFEWNVGAAQALTSHNLVESNIGTNRLRNCAEICYLFALLTILKVLCTWSQRLMGFNFQCSLERTQTTCNLLVLDEVLQHLDNEVSWHDFSVYWRFLPSCFKSSLISPWKTHSSSVLRRITCQSTLSHLLQGCSRVAKLLRMLITGGDDATIGMNGVKTCLAILQTSVGEELGESFDQVCSF